MAADSHTLIQIRDAARGEARGQYFNRLLSLSGSAATYSHIGGASGVTDFFTHRQINSPVIMNRMLITVADGPSFDADDYGAIAGGLPNGVRLVVLDENSDILYHITDPIAPVKNNGQWAQYAFRTQLIDYGSGDNFLSIDWSFSDAGRPIFIQAQHRIAVLTTDDFSALSGQTFTIQGYALPYDLSQVFSTQGGLAVDSL